MAYAFTVVGPAVVGDELVWEIYESDVGTASEWSITNWPKTATITLIETNLLVAGSAATVQPAVGGRAGFTSGGAHELAKADAAAAYVSIGQDKRVTNQRRRIYGQSRPNVATGATGRINTRVTARHGHR